MLNTLLQSLCAGLTIALGGSVFLACGNRYAGAVLFSVALLCICYLGYYLYTGKIGFFPEDATRKNALHLAVGLCGNLLAAFAAGWVVRVALPTLGEQAATVMADKLLQSFPQSLLRGMFCGMLMYLAVALFRKGTPFGVLFCVPVFILCGFEHSIADMFYFGASGLMDGQAARFFPAVVLGNTLGAMLLPLLDKIGKIQRKEEKQDA